MTSLARAVSREIVTPMMNSHRWDDFAPRDGDVVVATYPKCGTTWTQRIVDLLVFQSAEPRPIMQIAPWLDCVFMAPHEVNLANLQAQTHRRSMKSHLPLDALPVYDGVKYIHTARDGRDSCLSMHNHELGGANRRATLVAAGQAVPQGLTRRDIPADPREFFLTWIEEAESVDPRPDAGLPFCEFEQTYWDERRRPNLLLVHYADLKADLTGEMARIAAFLEIDTPPALMDELVHAARFETMKAQGEEILPGMEQGFDHGSQRFLHRGENGRWLGVLNDDDLARYEALAAARLSPGLNDWIHSGRRGRDPRQAGD